MYSVELHGPVHLKGKLEGTIKRRIYNRLDLDLREKEPLRAPCYRRIGIAIHPKRVFFGYSITIGFERAPTIKLHGPRAILDG